MHAEAIGDAADFVQMLIELIGDRMNVGKRCPRELELRAGLERDRSAASRQSDRRASVRLGLGDPPVLGGKLLEHREHADVAFVVNGPTVRKDAGLLGLRPDEELRSRFLGFVEDAEEIALARDRLVLGGVVGDHWGELELPMR